MVKATDVNTKVSLKYAEGSFTYSKIKQGADIERLYELADAINSLQAEVPEKIVKIVETELVEMII